MAGENKNFFVHFEAQQNQDSKRNKSAEYFEF